MALLFLFVDGFGTFQLLKLPEVLRAVLSPHLNKYIAIISILAKLQTKQLLKYNIA